MPDRNVSPRFMAGGDIYPARFIEVDTAADNQAIGCVAGRLPIGISQSGPKVPITNPQGQLGGSASVSPDLAAASGDTFQSFGVGDICWLECGTGGLTRGDWVRASGTTTRVGTGVTGTPGTHNIGAKALESGLEFQLVRVQIILLSISGAASGATGATGASGAPGGASGVPGASGTPGASGVPGASGAPGASGVPGASGIPA